MTNIYSIFPYVYYESAKHKWNGNETNFVGVFNLSMANQSFE